MNHFAYTAVNLSGNTVRGSVAARSRQEVYRELEKLALTPVTIDEKEATAAQSASDQPPPRLKTSQLILFTDELADMLDSGLQLEQSLRILETRQAEPALQRVAARLREEIREGSRFATALSKSSPSFDEIYINMAAAGEAGGSLTSILRQLSSNLHTMNNLRNKVIGAMIYPAVLFGACAVLLGVFGVVLMPQLTDLMSFSNQKLPLVTQLLVNLSNFMARWWWLFLIIGVAAALSFKAWVGTKAGRATWDEGKLALPLFGPVLSSHYYAQYCHAMCNLVTNGVPLLNSLQLMGRATKNLFLRRLQEEVIEEVGEGASLSRAMRKVGSFPGKLTDTIGVGEQTGHLGTSLGKAAARYDKELNTRISRLTTLISPVILIFMAVIVGVVSYAIISAMFQSATGLRQTPL
ncbi:MAG: type II secretion system F family protein [Verrucomicrobiota bacterium]